MAQQKIIIDIDEQGHVQVEGEGFAGAECQALTRDLEHALGEVERVTLKPEYRQTKAAVRKATA